MKLYQILGQGDPYEPGHTLAICTSIESVKTLSIKNIHQFIRREPMRLKNGNITDYGQANYNRNDLDKEADYTEYLNLSTNKTKRFYGQSFGPSIYLEEIEADVKL